ncbi:hypothetical protein HJG60_010396 [Phyllostomus discolor]|uniref:Uncharacterized protein n=1 Tax=Phyllostomus discolor TaxID=89673 RepID=A0A834EGK0_9CHIR|nr:hypothetical protein HJG60_010396 [Phyllostomus discolor]
MPGHPEPLQNRTSRLAPVGVAPQRPARRLPAGLGGQGLIVTSQAHHCSLSTLSCQTQEARGLGDRPEQVPPLQGLPPPTPGSETKTTTCSFLPQLHAQPGPGRAGGPRGPSSYAPCSQLSVSFNVLKTLMSL